MNITRSYLRDLAIAHTLFTPTSLPEAIQRLGFIQADPIRSPARAQDLILRLRVENYCVNDLENNYPHLEIEEDFLYAYGFITQTLHQYIHPRKVSSLRTLEKKILLFAQQSKQPLNSRELENIFGRERQVNAWGGYSQAIKISLENLHHAGLLRISGREKGRRIYLATQPTQHTEEIEKRLEKLVLAVVDILSPVSEQTLREALFRVRQYIGDTKPIIEKLVKNGMLERHTIDHLTYLWTLSAMKEAIVVPRTQVMFLAPFDPLVWDRRRFEHLWGWAYRFEAYTPQSKRIRGYYALPLLWKDSIIGWANVKTQDGKMKVEVGYVDGTIKDSQFKDELKKEIERMENFLG